MLLKGVFNSILIISGLMCSVDTLEDVILTSTKLIKTTSPTTMRSVRRVFDSSAPKDLFYAKELKRKNDIETVWNWDSWCQKQPKAGNCTNWQPTVVYYYDSQLDQCITFNYSGCSGNENNFRTLIECERYCKGTKYTALLEKTNIIVCELQPNAGQCLALFKRYYFDVNDNECKKFFYGGCGGNQNRFKTKEECKQSCRKGFSEL